MKVFIHFFFASFLLYSQLSIAQISTYDVLWEEDFEDGNYDPSIFVGASDYNPEVKTGVFGDQALFLDAGYGFAGHFTFDLSLSVTAIDTYDSLVIELLSGLYIEDFPKVSYAVPCDPVINPECFFGEETLYTASLLTNNYAQGDVITLCKNCNEYIFEGKIGAYLNYRPDNNTYSRDVSYLASYKKDNQSTGYYIGEKFKLQTTPSDIERAKDEFCTAVATEFGTKTLDFNTWVDCAYINGQFPNGVNDLFNKAEIRRIRVLGYKKEVVTGLEHAESNESTSVIKVYDLQGKEVTNPKNSLYIAQFSDDSRRIAFFDSDGVLITK